MHESMRPADPLPSRASTVLVIDDEPGILDVLSIGLAADDLVVRTARDVAGALLAFDRQAPPDIVVLDIGLPGGDGLGLLRRIRAMSDIPVVMLTARGAVEDRVRALELGADDYVAKPFSLDELAARIRAHLRRRALDRDATSAGTSLAFADLKVDVPARRATRAGRILELTPREFELLTLLLREPGAARTKDDILEQVWGVGYDANIVEVYVGYLRRKLGGPPLIQTVRGVGYRLGVAEEVPDPGRSSRAPGRMGRR
jgi:DNA-binding response OmpR family regulator